MSERVNEQAGERASERPRGQSCVCALLLAVRSINSSLLELLRPPTTTNDRPPAFAPKRWMPAHVWRAAIRLCFSFVRVGVDANNNNSNNYKTAATGNNNRNHNNNKNKNKATTNTHTKTNIQKQNSRARTRSITRTLARTRWSASCRCTKHCCWTPGLGAGCWCASFL